jgi:renalase
MKRIAIVGAGIAGLAAAWALRGHPYEVVLFEKSRGVAGRAATRGKNGARYDHGASYFKTDTEALEVLVHRTLPSEELVAILGDVWTFDGAGRMAPGAAEQSHAPKWTYRRGISTLGKLLADASGAAVHRQVRIRHLDYVGEQWWLVDTAGAMFGPFDAVVLTPPAPQTADLLEASRLDAALQQTLSEALRQVSYRTQLSCMLGYGARVIRPVPCYALLNTDRAHDIAWLSFEEDKPGHVPDGESVLIVQMAPDWSVRHYEEDPAVLASRVAKAVSELLGTDVRRPAWIDVQRWRYAQPEGRADVAALRRAAPAGLFFAGDALAGTGRVQRALETGLAAAEAVLSPARR